jgi:hypothetical protein
MTFEASLLLVVLFGVGAIVYLLHTTQKVLLGALIDIHPTLVFLGAGGIILASVGVALASRADRALG